MRIVFADDLHQIRDGILTGFGANLRLKSYWFFRDRAEDCLHRLVMTGTHVGIERKKLSGSSKPLVTLILDSGAFSAWKRDEKIDRQKYLTYIRKNEKKIHRCVNLDTIPGRFGIKRTKADVDFAAEQSYENQQWFKSKGIHPIPVFHQGEDLKWLDRYLDDGEDYIGISPMGDLPVTATLPWLDEMFNLITDKDGWPKFKTHGFGVASFNLMKRYPWYTCDATSWAQTAGFGSIYIPVYRNGVPAYGENPVKLTVSTQGKEVMKQGQKTVTLASDHYLRLGSLAQGRVKEFLKEAVGLTVEQVAEDYKARCDVIVYCLLQFQNAIGEQPFKFKRRGFV